MSKNFKQCSTNPNTAQKIDCPKVIWSAKMDVYRFSSAIRRGIFHNAFPTKENFITSTINNIRFMLSKSHNLFPEFEPCLISTKQSCLLTDHSATGLVPKPASSKVILVSKHGCIDFNWDKIQAGFLYIRDWILEIQMPIYIQGQSLLWYFHPPKLRYNLKLPTLHHFR